MCQEILTISPCNSKAVIKFILVAAFFVQFLCQTIYKNIHLKGKKSKNLSSLQKTIYFTTSFRAILDYMLYLTRSKIYGNGGMENEENLEKGLQGSSVRSAHSY